MEGWKIFAAEKVKSLDVFYRIYWIGKGMALTLIFDELPQ